MYTLSDDLVNDNAQTQADCCPVFIKYFEGYNYNEIAETLNLPIGVVKERIKNNKRRLRTNLKLFIRRFKALA